MSSQEWLPDGHRGSSEGGDPTEGRPYLTVPALVVGRNLHVNAAGWSDSSAGGGVVCRICNKQIRAQLSELALFPLVKPESDLLRFTYVLPPHRVGGGFSIEICRGSGTSVSKDIERPTSIRYPGRDGAPPSGQGGPTDRSGQDDADAERAKKELDQRLDGLSREEAEERYNYLNSKSISELTDAEYEERLALALRLSEKLTDSSKEGQA